VDNSPPSVSVEVPPATSAKNLRDIDSSAPDQPEKLPNSQDNPDYVKNYVNGVIQFTIGANDNFVLDLDDTNGGGLKWWLIPHNAPAPAYDDPFPQDVPANAGTYTGLGGVLSRRPFVVRVNTKLKRDGTSITGTLPDSDQVFPSGKYKLYILAKDKAGNKVITTGLQASNEYKGASPQLPLSYTIDQRSDLPEFRIIRPQGVEGLTTLMISGTLADDDGFQITDLVPAHAPVQVRISPYADTAAVPPDVDEWLDQGTNNGWKIVNNNQSQNQSLKLDAGLVSFEYGLSGPEKTALGSDGRKRFMVKVTDAPNNKTKLINTDPYYPSYATFDEYIHIGGEDEAAYNGIMFGSEQTRVYTFILDTKSPEFKIRDPMVDPSVTITGNEWNETLVPAFKNGSTPPKFSGELTEANLKYDRKGQFGTLPDSDKPGGVNPGSFHITVTVSDKQNGKDVVWTYALRQTDSANNNALNYITTEAEHQGGDLYKWVVGESGYYRDGASIEYYPDPSRGGDYTKNVFEMLADGPHTITFSADDESAKTTSKPYSFVKDNTPPAIQYTNLYGDMYLSSNGNERPGTAAWESKDETAKKKWLAERLALKTVITSNTPVLSGSFSDTASDIYEKFQYRIDSTSSVDPWNDSKISTDAGYDETKTPYISGTGKTVQWYIPIGEGTANALLDGLHWVEIKATDTAGGGMGNTTADANVRKIYFILDRGAPRIFGLRASPEDTSYGTPSPGATLVTLSGLVVDENLQSMLAWLDTSGTKYGVTILSSFTPDTDETQAIYNWLAGIPDPAEKTRLSGLIRKWQWSMTANEFNHTALGGSAFSGSKSIRIGAYDFSATDDALAKVTTSDSGQGKAHIEWKFTKDSTKPTFTWPNINRSNGSAGTASADKRFVGMANPQLQGSASDANSGVKSVETYLERWNYSYNNGAGRYELLNPDPTASGSPDNGWYALPINAGQKTVNWSKSLAGLPEGLYRISFRVKDISVGSGNPYVTSTETPSQGYAEFFIGSADPDLEIVPATPFKNYYPGGDIVLSGTNLTAASVNRIKTITVKLIEVSTSITEVTRTLTPGSGITYDALVNWNIKQTCTWTTTIAAPTAPTRDGAWRIEITAEDYAGRKRTKTKDFTLDNTKPTLTLEDPKPEGGNDGAIVPAGQQLVVSGGSSDLNGIDEFYWYAGIKNLDDVNAAVEGTKDGWKKLSNTNPTLNVWDSSGGAPSDVKVTSNTNPYSWSLTFIEDATYHSIRSLAQNDGFTEPTNQGGYRKLILRFKVKDKTGNIKYFDHYLWIDLEADIPGAVITSPATGISRGGAIQISGTVSDNEAVNRVVFRVIDASGSPVPSAVLQTSGGVNTYTVTEPGYPVLGTPSYVDTAIDALGTEEKYKGGWQEVMLRNGFTRNADPKTGSFDFVINSTGLLDPDDPADPIGRKVRVQVRALDGPAGDENIYQGISTYGKSSDIEINITAGKVQVIGASTSGTAGSHIYVTFDAGTGTVNHFSPSVTYHGNITFNAIIRSVNPLKLAQWQDDINHGSASFTPAVDPSNPPTQSGGYYTYNVSYTMNTASFTSAQGKIFEHGAGNYNFTITAQDNDNSNPMTAQYTFAINIDNSVPWAQYYPVNSNPAVNDGTNSLSSNPYVAGTNYTFSGRALDADPDNTLSQKPSYTKTGSLEKVVFWIKKGGAIVNLLGNAGTATTVSMSNIPKQQRGPYALDGSTSFTTVQVTAPKHDVQNIDGWRAIITATESGADSPSGLSRDGIYPVGFSGSGNARDWNLRLDTTKLPDGPATACYLLYDAAGNVSYHEQDIVVRNQAPVITQVKLSTGLQSSTPDPVNGAKTLNTFTNGKLVNADFIARNNALRFEVTTNRGTRYADTVPRLRYRLAYVSSLTLETASLSAGDYYLIKTAGTNVNWQNFGAVDSSPGTVFYANDNAPLTNGAEAYKLNRTADQTPQTTITPDVNDPVTQSFDFTNFANIPDAGTTGYAAGVPNHNANNQSLFLLKIWDYNQPGPEAFQLSEVVLIGLKVQNTDTEKPVVEVYPLNPRTDETVGSGNPLVTEGMKPGTGVGPAGSGKIAAANRSRPGLFNKTSNPNDLVKSGHIEPRTGSPVLSQTGGVGLAANDTVSGAIILRGYATDNQRIRYIDVNINNAGWTTILEAPGGGGSLAAASGQRAWITDEIDLAGHRVEWSWVWDTETLGVILGAETVEVRARDYAANISDRVTTGNNRNYFSVDAAAYVTGIERPVTNGASGAANRSKQGWYAFYQGETGITLKGYNLKTASSTPSLTLNGTTLTTSVPTIHSITFSVPASISKGGAIVYRPGVTVGTTDSVNNRVSRAVSGSPSYYRPNSWNQETWRNTAGSTLWTDQLNAHVWRTLQNDADANNRTAIVNSANGEYGAMAMNPNDGKLYATWRQYSTNRIWMGGNSSTVATNSFYMSNYDDIHRETDIAFGAYGGSGGKIGNNNPRMHWVSNYLRDFGTGGEAGIYTGYRELTETGYTSNYKQLQRPSFSANQFQNPRVTATEVSEAGYADRTYTSFYDSTNARLVFYRHSWGGNDGTNANMRTGGITLDGSVNTNTAVAANGISRSTDAGLWSAIDYDSSNFPVVAYYDSVDNNLRIAYSDSVNPTAGANWTRTYVLPTSHPYFNGSGTYVSMKIQRTGTRASDTIHLAFINTVYNTVVYAKGTFAQLGLTAFTAVAVDSTGAAPNWTDIAVDKDGSPWISYGDKRLGGKDGIKLAYKDATKFTRVVNDTAGNAVTGWETMSVPTQYSTIENRISMEAWPAFNTPTANYGTQTWNAAIGYNSDRFRIAYFTKP
jgi:hypothetical protein